MSVASLEMHGCCCAGSESVLVLCEATHMCMVARGVEKHASSTVTTAARGGAQHSAALRSQMLLRLTSSAAMQAAR
jgi:GTP cyclohydrolase I